MIFTEKFDILITLAITSETIIFDNCIRVPHLSDTIPK